MNCMVKVLKEDTILFHHNGFMLVKLSFSEYRSFGVCSFGFIHFGTRYVHEITGVFFLNIDMFVPGTLTVI